MFQQYYPEPKIDLPEKFDGTRYQFRGFISQIHLIIQLQPRRYPTSSTQIGLVGSLLKGSALVWFAPLLETASPLLSDFKAFLAEFKATFGNSDKVRTASNKIRKLQQGRRPAAIYASEFRLLACDLSWDNAALIDQFRHGLQDEVKDLLLTMEDPKDLNEAISQAVRCDNRLFEQR